jgi:hypothetical protein
VEGVVAVRLTLEQPLLVQLRVSEGVVWTDNRTAKRMVYSHEQCSGLEGTWEWRRFGTCCCGGADWVLRDEQVARTLASVLTW